MNSHHPHDPPRPAGRRRTGRPARGGVPSSLGTPEPAGPAPGQAPKHRGPPCPRRATLALASPTRRPTRFLRPQASTSSGSRPTGAGKAPGGSRDPSHKDSRQRKLVLRAQAAPEARGWQPTVGGRARSSRLGACPRRGPAPLPSAPASSGCAAAQAPGRTAHRTRQAP